jgi:hypothetical protein
MNAPEKPGLPLTWRQLLAHGKGVILGQLNLVQVHGQHVPEKEH